MPPQEASSGSVAAIVEIGSSIVRMRIVHLADAGWHEIDVLEQSVRIGREVFTARRISFDSVAALSRILSGFSRVMKEYGVSRTRVIATTALREAENRDYVIDLLRVQNGISIDVLEEAAESAFAFGRILNRHPEAVRPAGTLMAYLGTGNVGLAYARDHRVLFSSSLPTGIQRLNDLLSGIQDQTSHYHDVLEEYVRTVVNHARIHLEGLGIEGLVLNGRHLPQIASLCGAVSTDGVFRVARPALRELYSRIRERTTVTASASEEGEGLFPLLAVVMELLSLCRSEEVLIPDYDISDVVIDNMNSRETRALHHETMRLNALESARHMAAAYRCDLAHADLVAQCALHIFDSLRKPHGLGRRARLLLEVSAWLHDVGYFVNARNHRAIAFELLRGTTLFGLGEHDMFLIACIAGFDEYESSVDRFRTLPFTEDKDRIIATKLAAILQLANALDQSHTQRLEDPRAELEDGRLTIRCRSLSDAVLERWALKRWTSAFEDVFGVQPELVVETTLL